MTICFVFGCNHQGLRRTCKMFRFPASSGLSKKWEKLCRRKDSALVMQSDRICSCHFVDGDKNNGPTIFPWSCGKLFDFPDPTKINRTEREENQKMAVSSTSTSALSAMHCASSSIDSTSAHKSGSQLPDFLSPFKRRESEPEVWGWRIENTNQNDIHEASVQNWRYHRWWEKGTFQISWAILKSSTFVIIRLLIQQYLIFEFMNTGKNA